jgi:hypothetical protein
LKFRYRNLQSSFPYHSSCISKQQCLKILPYVLSFIGLFFVLFAVWVRSIPPQSLPVQNQTTNPVMPPKEEFSTSSSEDFEMIEDL